MITLAVALDLLKTTKPTAGKAIDALVQAGILQEITGKRRDRIYAYRSYLNVLAEDVPAARAAENPRTFESALETVHKRFGRAMKRLAE
jgi:hypothetical protein